MIRGYGGVLEGAPVHVEGHYTEPYTEPYTHPNPSFHVEGFDEISGGFRVRFGDGSTKVFHPEFLHPNPNPNPNPNPR